MLQSLSPDMSHKLANMGFVCACLVVFIHVEAPSAEGSWGWWLALLMKEGVCRIAVPFFFAAAGFFLAGHAGETGWWRREVGKRGRSLLLPYLLWPLLWTVYGSLLAVIANFLAGAEWTRNLPLDGREWLETFGLDPRAFPRLGPLWFVRCLLLLVLLSPLPMVAIRRGRGWGLALLASLWVLYGWWRSLGPMEGGTFPEIWRVTLSLEGVFYFVLGLFLRWWPVAFRLPRWGAWGILGVGVAGFALAAASRLTASDWGIVAQWVGGRWLWSALALWGVWRLMPSAPWPRWLTGAAFPIFLMHMFVLQTLASAAHNLTFCPEPESGFGAYFLFGGVAIAASIGGAWALRRSLPRVAAVLFGGR